MASATEGHADDHGHGGENARETFRGITRDVTKVNLTPIGRWWYPAFGVSLLLLGMLVVAVTHLFRTGIGVWGNNNVQGWAWDITNFVFWVGIGHAGTLISAVLYL